MEGLIIHPELQGNTGGGYAIMYMQSKFKQHHFFFSLKTGTAMAGQRDFLLCFVQYLTLSEVTACDEISPFIHVCIQGKEQANTYS